MTRKALLTHMAAKKREDMVLEELYQASAEAQQARALEEHLAKAYGPEQDPNEPTEAEFNALMEQDPNCERQ